MNSIVDSSPATTSPASSTSYPSPASATGRGSRQRHGLEVARDEQVGSDGVLVAVDDEVGEDAVDARVVECEARRPGAVCSHGGMGVDEADEVAPDDDEVHRLRVLEVELGHRAVVAADRERVRGGLPAASVSVSGTIVKSFVDARRGRAARPAGGHPAVLGGRLGVRQTDGLDELPTPKLAAKTAATPDAVDGELGRGVHAVTPERRLVICSITSSD